MKIATVYFAKRCNRLSGRLCRGQRAGWAGGGSLRGDRAGRGNGHRYTLLPWTPGSALADCLLLYGEWLTCSTSRS